MAGTSISFDGNDLQTASIQTAYIDHHSGPTKNATLYGLSHANLSSIPFISYPTKPITVTGRLVADTIALTDTLIDTFKGYFNGKDKNLDIGYGGSTRRYICTAQTPQIPRPNGLSYADFTLIFDCTQPFGRDTTTTSALHATARTSASYNDTYTFLGNAPAQIPMATITLNSVTNPTGGMITFGNNATGQQISITRTWTAGDILVIDPTNITKPITVNGAAAEYIGAFPIFDKGSGTMTYLDNFSARNFDIDIVYYPMYL